MNEGCESVNKDLEYRRRVVRESSLSTDEQVAFVDNFIGYAFGREENVLCPCRRCLNRERFRSKEVLRLHLIMNGFDPSYDVWTFHGEFRPNSSNVGEVVKEEEEKEKEKCGFDNYFDKMRSDFAEEPEILAKMLGEQEIPLYEGCKEGDTVMSCLMEVFNMKAASGWSDLSVNRLLGFLHNKLPVGNSLPSNLYRAKKMLCPYEMEYEKIHACPNDCILYRGKYEKETSCHVCKANRYKKAKNRKGEEIDGGEDDSKVPTKCIWYLPIVPRFQRLFGNVKDAKNMTWHCDRERPFDDMIRHPSDGDQWKKIDRLYPDFGKGDRNLRLALSTDGMSPFSTMSSKHSTWPVMLVIYNLPSYLCMKRKYVMMPLLISGPRQPGNDIDVFLAPLIEDLRELWIHGVEMKDAYRGDVFNMKAVLLWSISDFPALGNLGGYVAKGHKACPVCEEETEYKQLKFGKKAVYMGHRRFLKHNHPYREDVDGLFGGKEVRDPPSILTGRMIHLKMKKLTVVFGKKVKKPSKNEKSPWKKRSIFFELLPYWEVHEVRHCLDVMHIEKNVCDSLVGTLLNIASKTKDNLNARKDLVDLGLRLELAPEEKGNRTYLPPGPCNLSKAEKQSVCDSLMSMKVPIGYSSNISRCVKADLKLSGLKSHDCHVLMQQLLPVAIRGVLDVQVRICITRLCFFFHTICRKSISRQLLESIEVEAFEILATLELYFPPNFFDIMVHLIGHLVREIRICGPVGMHWMYPFERQMGGLKGYNKCSSRPDASIVESYVTEEVIEYCTSFLEKGMEFGVPQNRHVGRKMGSPRGPGRCKRPTDSELERAHHYILRNSSETVSYVDEHLNYLATLYPGRGGTYIQARHTETFVEWFEGRCNVDGIDENLRSFARKPNSVVRSYSGYDINGYSYTTERRDSRTTTQSSGVYNESEQITKKGPSIESFYGVIDQIWELDYSAFKCVVFKCKWVSNEGGVDLDDPMGFTRVDLKNEGYQDDCFILAAQARQVFYVEDPSDKKWSIVLQGKKYFFEEEIDCEVVNDKLEFPTAFPGHCKKTEMSRIKRGHDDGLWVDAKGNLIEDNFPRKKNKS